MLIKELSNLILSILFLKRLVNGQFYSLGPTNEMKNQDLIESIIKLSDQLLPYSGFILDKIFSSKLVNNCELKCPLLSKFETIFIQNNSWLIYVKLETRTKNPFHIPNYNGCGSYNFLFDFRKVNLDGFNECCAFHDICYGSCTNRSKIDCDTQFKDCLMRKCANIKRRYLKDPPYDESNSL